MLLGDWSLAEERLQEALSHMREEVVDGEKEKRTQAMIASEDLKYFKGDIYEAAMANYYCGMLDLAKGNVEDALVGVKRSLLNDMESKNIEHQDDFGATHFLAGLTYNRLEEKDNAALAFNKVKALNGQFAAPERFNTVMLIELGDAPMKVTTGIEGESDDVVRSSYPEASVELIIDGANRGRATKVMDLYEQASTVGRTAKDVLQGGKAALKFLVRMSAACVSSDLSNAVGRAWDVRADTRTWDNLPGEIHVLLCELPEGLHTVTLKFYNASNQELKRYEQTWYCLPVLAEQANLFLFQSGYDRCNITKPLELTRIIKVAEKTNTAIFFANDLGNMRVGETLDIVSLGKPVLDDAGEILDVEIDPVGRIEVTEIKGKKAFGRICDSECTITREMFLARL